MLKYKKISSKLIALMLSRAHNPRRAKIRTAFFKDEYALLKEKIVNQDVLVAGSGLGHDAFILAKNNRRIVGVDIIGSFIIHARRRAKKLKIQNVDFYKSDIMRLPHPADYFDAAVLNMGTIGNFDDTTLLIKKLLHVTKKLYFDFYSPSKTSLLIRKKMYEEESWSKLYIKGKLIVNEDGFESRSFSKTQIKKIVETLGSKVKFYAISNFAYMAEVTKRGLL